MSDLNSELLDGIDVGNRIAMSTQKIIERTRGERIKRVKNSMKSRSKTRRDLIYEKCKRDPIFFINNYVWSVDPRLSDRKTKRSNKIPLRLYPHQEKLVKFFIKCLESETDGTVEKSRDQGFTWVSCAFAVWMWIFQHDIQIGFGSRLERNVYKRGDDGAIFTKLAYIISHLPNWLKPIDYDERKHYNEMILVNPNNRSVIWGGSGDNMARGKRASIFFADEHAFITRAKEVDGALSQLARCIIYGSTPNGASSFFKTKVDNSHLYHIRLHWRDDPRKDQAWYEKMVMMYDKETVAREIDINHNASVRGVAIRSEWIQAAIDVVIPRQEEINSVTIGGLDISVGGDDMPLITRRGPFIESIEIYEDASPDFSASAEWVMDNFIGSHLYYDSDGVGATFGPALRDRSPDFDYFPVNSGGRASERIYAYDINGKDVYGYTKFVNIKAELWALIRQRFINTYKYHVKNIDCDPNEMIKLRAQDVVLNQQIGWYRFERGSSTRTKMNDKREFSQSPDFADAFCYSFMSEISTLVFDGDYFAGVVA